MHKRSRYGSAARYFIGAMLLALVAALGTGSAYRWMAQPKPNSLTLLVFLVLLANVACIIATVSLVHSAVPTVRMAECAADHRRPESSISKTTLARRTLRKLRHARSSTDDKPREERLSCPVPQPRRTLGWAPASLPYRRRYSSPAPVTILATGQWLVTADTLRYHVSNDPAFPGDDREQHGCGRAQDTRRRLGMLELRQRPRATPAMVLSVKDSHPLRGPQSGGSLLQKRLQNRSLLRFSQVSELMTCLNAN